jgi:hypothetical protein
VRRRTTSIVVVASLALLATGVANATSSAKSTTARFGARLMLDTAVSSNWAGYVASAPSAAQPAPASGLSFTDVAGSWVQPHLTCSAGEVGAAAFWVGLGGAQGSSSGGSQTPSSALEQVGTEGDCSRNGRASYFAWYEFLPAGPVTIKLKVRPRDRITGAVLISGSQVIVTLKNLTTHKRFSKRFGSVSPLDVSSAEWIAEAPSLCSSSNQCTPVPLPNFGTVAFTNATAIANGHPGTLSDSTWSSAPIVLAPDPAAPTNLGLAPNTHGATPSPIGADGRSFTVSWQETISRSG